MLFMRSAVQDAFVNTVEEQKALLKNKPCDCPLILNAAVK
jgi:hypothetical protein